ncbi:hypothetical protein A6A07_07385 [Streptomyces sp. CB03911]|nr:hypothetical protein A6A07_07385 [Streptomyces sp. CB03911]
MARLSTHVHLTRDGRTHVFGPADDLPAWAVPLITNPKAWDVPPALEPEPVPEAPKAVKRVAPRARKGAADGPVHGS